MTDAKKDQNRIAVGIGVNSDDGVTPMPLTVDASTGRLLVVVAASPTGGDVPHEAPAKRDANGNPVAMGRGSDSKDYMFLTDKGYLLCDMVIEP